AEWGPVEGLEAIPAQAYETGDEIRIASPARSVQYLLIDGTVDRIKTASALPGIFNLSQNFPNPFNARTTITYTLPHAAAVDLRIHDLNGREIKVLLDGQKMSAGEHSLAIDTTQWPSTIYFYTLRSGSWSETRKMVMIK
ncbi:MAG TPA: T9SS type A sorting domain-containing protein, partial [bacterium]|nr:T9SS type A sorting domain-containing protein [bacterium]